VITATRRDITICSNALRQKAAYEILFTSSAVLIQKGYGIYLKMVQSLSAALV
jgi:hypothetical protein